MHIVHHLKSLFLISTLLVICASATSLIDDLDVRDVRQVGHIYEARSVESTPLEHLSIRELADELERRGAVSSSAGGGGNRPPRKPFSNLLKKAKAKVTRPPPVIIYGYRCLDACSNHQRLYLNQPADIGFLLLHIKNSHAYDWQDQGWRLNWSGNVKMTKEGDKNINVLLPFETTGARPNVPVPKYEFDPDPHPPPYNDPPRYTKDDRNPDAGVPRGNDHPMPGTRKS